MEGNDQNTTKTAKKKLRRAALSKNQKEHLLSYTTPGPIQNGPR